MGDDRQGGTDAKGWKGRILLAGGLEDMQCEFQEESIRILTIASFLEKKVK